MKSISSKINDLFELIKEVAHLTKTKNPDTTQDLTFHMHSSCKGSWDEIWLISGKINTGIKQPFIRISLSGLSDTERMQLATLVNHHNTNCWPIKVMLTEAYLHMRDQLNTWRLPLPPLRPITNEL